MRGRGLMEMEEEKDGSERSKERKRGWRKTVIYRIVWYGEEILVFLWLSGFYFLVRCGRGNLDGAVGRCGRRRDRYV